MDYISRDWNELKQLKELIRRESSVANCMKLNSVFQWFKMEMKIRCI